MAHNNFYILEKLLRLLDDPRNDIYIHIDTKAVDFDENYFKGILKYSKLMYTQRTNVIWGDYSQINCELLLLKEATSNFKYDYYHLISGVDLPLKSQEEIHKFFDENQGKEFVHFNGLDLNQSTYNRASLYHLFSKYGRNRSMAIDLIDRIILKLQRIFKVDRLKNSNFKLAFGANWFSITDNLARYVIQQDDMIKKVFSKTVCADELFLQSLVYNSKFKENLYYDKMDENYIACLRYIDWHREDCTSSPHVWRSEEFDELVSSNFLFARKFDCNVDKQIVDKIFDFVLKK